MQKSFIQNFAGKTMQLAQSFEKKLKDTQSKKNVTKNYKNLRTQLNKSHQKKAAEEEAIKSCNEIHDKIQQAIRLIAEKGESQSHKFNELKVKTTLYTAVELDIFRKKIDEILQTLIAQSNNVLIKQQEDEEAGKAAYDKFIYDISNKLQKIYEDHKTAMENKAYNIDNNYQTHEDGLYNECQEIVSTLKEVSEEIDDAVLAHKVKNAQKTYSSSKYKKLIPDKSKISNPYSNISKEYEESGFKRTKNATVIPMEQITSAADKLLYQNPDEPFVLISDPELDAQLQSNEEDDDQLYEQMI